MDSVLVAIEEVCNMTEFASSAGKETSAADHLSLTTYFVPIAAAVTHIALGCYSINSTSVVSTRPGNEAKIVLSQSW